MIGRYACFAVWLIGLLAAAPIAMSQSQSVPGAPLHLVLKGYDPVAYFTDSKPTPGKAEYEFVFDGARYRFASAQHLEQFKADPDRYAPQYAGSCASGIAAGVKVEAQPEYWLIVDGKLFVFSVADGPDQMRADSANMITTGRDNWKALANAPFH
jgi:YHS domain-containing protein